MAIKRDRCWRRAIHKKKDARTRTLISYGVHLGSYVDWHEPARYSYVKHMSRWNSRRFYKRYSNRVARKSVLYGKGNRYRKEFELWWTLF